MRRRMRCRRGRRLGFQLPSIKLPIRLPRTTSSKVEEIKVEEIYELLPKRDCGACGYESCYECAAAIAKGEAPLDACRIVGKKVAPQIEKILRR